MIKKADLALPLRKKAIEISTANDYKFVFEGKKFKPVTGSVHITENVLFGEDNKIGMEDRNWFLLWIRKNWESKQYRIERDKGFPFPLDSTSAIKLFCGEVKSFLFPSKP